MNVENIMNSKEILLSTYICKIFFISLYTYCTCLKIVNKEDILKNKLILLMLYILGTCIITGIIKSVANSYVSIIFLFFFLSLIVLKKINCNIGYAIIVTLISLSLNYIILFCAIVINFLFNMFLYIENDYINLAIMAIIHGILLYFLFKIKKFKHGFSFLKDNFFNEYTDLIILDISVIVVFSSIIFTSFNIELTRSILIGFIIFTIIMFITIQKSLQLYYKQKLLIQDLEETKKELETKNKEIEQLEKENLNFSKTSHSIAHKQKSLEYKLNELILKSEAATEIGIKDRINEISKEIYNKTTTIELAKTGIEEIDDMLKYMQSECTKNKIDFQLQLSENIYKMTNNHISKEKLEILIADHIKNAIIAINYSNNTNKSILVRLGMIDGFYSLYVYDSGIEFETDTLLNLGKKPSTTHADNGGTGMGFMNTFDTLNQYKASMVIKEYSKPCKNNYTKVIMIKFDKKNEFKICSYRSDKIKNTDKENCLTVEKISF